MSERGCKTLTDSGLIEPLSEATSQTIRNSGISPEWYMTELADSHSEAWMGSACGCDERECRPENHVDGQPCKCLVANIGGLVALCHLKAFLAHFEVHAESGSVITVMKLKAEFDDFFVQTLGVIVGKAS